MAREEHQTETDAAEAVHQSTEDARDDGRWLVAVFRLLPDGEVECRRTTWNFPRAALPAAVEALRRNLDAELPPPSDYEPLPMGRLARMATPPEEPPDAD